MRFDARPSTQSPGGRDLDAGPRAGPNSPHGSGGPVAENSPGSGGQDSRHPPALSGERAVPHRVDTLMHSMQPAALQPVPDRTSSDPAVGELPSGDDPMLP